MASKSPQSFKYALTEFERPWELASLSSVRIYSLKTVFTPLSSIRQRTLANFPCALTGIERHCIHFTACLNFFFAVHFILFHAPIATALATALGARLGCLIRPLRKAST